jgi:hypothetical protein
VNRAIASVTAAMLIAMPNATALAHGGGLDANGCHTNRKTGEYHCHRRQKDESQGTQSLRAPKASSNSTGSTARQPARSLPPGCYVGPRGGTYTITKSGRKNYSGC